MSNLKSCPDCGHKVSPKAASCPKCGRPNPSSVNTAYLAAQALVMIGGIVVVIGFIGQLLNPPQGLSNRPELIEMEEAAKAAKEAFE